MATRHAARIWALVGVLAAAALAGVGWFLLIAPQRAETRALHDQVAASETQAVVLQRRLTELEQQAADLPRYRAELAANRKALPTVPDTPDFVREMQAAGEQTNVSITGVSVGEPTAATGGAFALPITLTCQGGADQIQAFLDQLQRQRPRAVLIDTLSFARADDDSGSKYAASIQLDAFVAP